MDGTRMMAIYCHLTDTDIDAARILRLNDSTTCNNRQTANAHYALQHCMIINEPGSKFWVLCTLLLSETEQFSMNQLFKKIEKHPLYLSLTAEMKKKIIELMANNLQFALLIQEKIGVD